MGSVMAVWTAVNSLLILVLVVALFLTIRQVGVLLGQVGPVGARGSTQGPRIGENVTAHVAALEPAALPRMPSLYVFVSESCAVCSAVRKGAETLTRYWSDRAAIRLVYDEHPRAVSVGPAPLRGLSFWHDRHLRERLGIELVPFAVMTTAKGEVIGKGIVNDVSQLESLLELLLQDRASTASGPADAEPLRIRA